MAIDKSGERWSGSHAGDIDEYLRAYTADGYPADRFVHARCECGGDRFRVRADADEGCAARDCVSCGRVALVCDSDEIWDEAEPHAVECPCGRDVFELAVGFSHRDDGTIRWITVGVRCVECGVLAAPAEWKIDYEPAEHLYDRV